MEVVASHADVALGTGQGTGSGPDRASAGRRFVLRCSGSSPRTSSRSRRRSAARSGRTCSPNGAPRIRVKTDDLARCRRRAGAEDGRCRATGCPVLEDGRVLDVANVIWCTGLPSRTSAGSTCRSSTRTGARARARSHLGAGPLLRRARLPLLVHVRERRRRRPRRAAHRQADRTPLGSCTPSRLAPRLVRRGCVVQAAGSRTRAKPASATRAGRPWPPSRRGRPGKPSRSSSATSPARRSLGEQARPEKACGA